MVTVRQAQRMVSIMEAAQIAKVTRRTIYNWLRKGRLVTIRTAGGKPRIDPQSLFRDGDEARG